jgi:hypothetical protein
LFRGVGANILPPLNGTEKVTKAIGLASLRSVIEEDAKFPATKSELTEKQGWKVFDLTEQEHVHASVLILSQSFYPNNT